MHVHKQLRTESESSLQTKVDVGSADNGTQAATDEDSTKETISLLALSLDARKTYRKVSWCVSSGSSGSRGKGFVLLAWFQRPVEGKLALDSRIMSLESLILLLDAALL